MELSKFSQKQSFQMEGVQEAVELTQRRDYGMLIDLKGCYLTMGLHSSQRRRYRFTCPSTGVRCQWKAVSFGTSEAPKICTKILRPLTRTLKSLNIRCLIYIDGLLILDQDPTRLAKAMSVAMKLLQEEVGLQLKLSKGNLLPTQAFTCLGIIWNSREMTCQIPPKRTKALQGTARRILRMSAGADGDGAGRPILTRDLARFVGQVVSTSRAIRPAKRRLLHIQHSLSKAVRRNGWRGTTSLSAKALRTLAWWTTEAPWKANGNTIVPPVRRIHISLRTDTATHNAGCGGVMQLGEKTFRTRGFLTEREQQPEFINEFEFMGFENSLWTLLPQAVPDRSLWSQVHVSVELNNVTSIKHGRVAVSQSIRMSLKGAKFFGKVEEAGLELSFWHLAGELNVAADDLSRRQSSHADWKLHPLLFQTTQDNLGLAPSIDLFASAQNTQVPRFFSYNFDHRAVAADAFLHSWHQLGTTCACPLQFCWGEYSRNHASTLVDVRSSHCRCGRYSRGTRPCWE
jgi:hypothetical protein